MNIEKYIEALNSLLGQDHAYYQGDKDVDAIVEVIVKVKELAEENEKLKERADQYFENLKAEQSETKYCRFCFNARVYQEPEDDWFSAPLTDENDSCSITVGKTSKNRRIFISSGHGEPTRIEFDEWFEEGQRWITTARYYPKYCPECGRKIDEYERKEDK